MTGGGDTPSIERLDALAEQAWLAGDL